MGNNGWTSAAPGQQDDDVAASQYLLHVEKMTGNSTAPPSHDVLKVYHTAAGTSTVGVRMLARDSWTGRADFMPNLACFRAIRTNKTGL